MRETLIEWHINDPVDQSEYRTTQLKADYQEGKVNPFVIDCSLVQRAYSDGKVDCMLTRDYDIDNINGPYVYPNPVTGFVSVKGLDSSADSLVIHDIHGNFIQKFKRPTAAWLDVSG